MTTRSSEARVSTPASSAYVAAGTILLVTTAGALVTYKTSGALKVLAKARAQGSLSPKAKWIDPSGFSSFAKPLVESLNYLSWVVVALAFGVLLGAMLRAFVPSSWLRRTLAVGGVRGYTFAALAGAPLMLCSCCVAPVFEGAYARTRRLGPSLGLMMAAPALNPAVLTVTFLVFSPTIFWTRAAMSVALVLGGAALIGNTFATRGEPEACPIETAAPSWSRMATGFGASLRDSAWRALPAIALGVVLSAVIAGVLPPKLVADATAGPGGYLAIVLVALVAVPLALPTFGEIPLALALMASGASAGVVVALLVAGPTINLPSLLTLARTASPRVAAALGATVFATAAIAGVAVHAFTTA